MEKNVVKIGQIKEARKLRDAFIKTTDGVERIPTMQEFVVGIIESDDRRDYEFAEHDKKQFKKSI